MTERDQARDRAGRNRADDRDHLEHARHEREEQSKWHLQHRKPDHRHRRHHADEKDLPPHVAAEQRVDLGEERDDLVPLAWRQETSEPLEEPRRVAQEEERRDEEDEEFEQEMTEADHEGDRSAGDHLA